MTFTSDQIFELLNGADDAGLYAKAQAAKVQVYGQEVYLRAIIEPWNTCRNNCLYCGLRKTNQNLTRFALSFADIYEAGLGILDHGITSLVLQAGEELDQDKIDLITKAVAALKKATKADITLSFGEHHKDTYKRWRDAGADRYLLKVETLDDQLYSVARPGCRLQDRLDCINTLLEQGYQVGSGFIAGMPHYTNAMLAKDLLRLSQMGLHMFSLSPFISTQDTPWAHAPRPDPELIHRACAIYRLLDPLVNIPVTSAMESLLQGSKALGLRRGCNVLMHSFTPASVRQHYRIYDGKNTVGDEALDQLKSLKQMVNGLGLFITEQEPGRSKKEIHHG